MCRTAAFIFFSVFFPCLPHPFSMLCETSCRALIRDLQPNPELLSCNGLSKTAAVVSLGEGDIHPFSLEKSHCLQQDSLDHCWLYCRQRIKHLMLGSVSHPWGFHPWGSHHWDPPPRSWHLSSSCPVSPFPAPLPQAGLPTAAHYKALHDWAL